MSQIEPLDASDYSLDDMSLRDEPVIALIEKVNEIVEVVNNLIVRLQEPK